MLDHPLIESRTGVDFREMKDAAHEIADHIIYTGPIDEYFDFRFGKLPYRSLKFDHQTLDQERHQPVAVVNYPDAGRALHAHQRVQAPDRAGTPVTTITYEYPSAEGDPYYPIPRSENQALFKKYEALADATERRDLRRAARHLPILQHGPDRRAGARDVPADRREARSERPRSAVQRAQEDRGRNDGVPAGRAAARAVGRRRMHGRPDR